MRGEKSMKAVVAGAGVLFSVHAGLTPMLRNDTQDPQFEETRRLYSINQYMVSTLVQGTRIHDT